MTRLSVNINKFATLRNARGGNNPNLIEAARNAERFGAEGITVHPRPDERHIRYSDVVQLAPIVTTEFNIEGYPDDAWMDLVVRTKPAQATLVPDGPDAITSNQGWNTVAHADFLAERLQQLKKAGIRSSLFVDPNEEMVQGAANLGSDRIELYTEPYAVLFEKGAKEKAIHDYVKCSALAHELGLGVNAGHDLDLKNLAYFKKNMPFLDEVSIGHALICDALYLGFENTIQLYLRALK